ncbi:cytochrome c oxidase accessory protein CcoG [Colwelliaceae bacterium BS250]
MKFDIKQEDLIIKPYKNDDSIYMRKQKGRFQQWRRYIGAVLLATFILLPWLSFNGSQAILLDVDAQRFHIFNLTLFPQDFLLLAWLLIVACFLLFFITTWLGRIWCGYTCPQTVWTFMYVWVEERIEGNHHQRARLDNSDWSINKLSKKFAKHSIWLLMSFLTATTFMSYFIVTIDLYKNLFNFDWSLLVTSWVGFFALCTYGNAGWLREKMCIYMCPYSRFQSAMFDSNTLVVAYDEQRGENRGRRKRGQDPKELDLGDCVDCNLCVEVCPVGIDIRNGLQYECIDCGACIDACDQTMKAFNYDTGLISYTSENALKGKKVKLLRPKIIGYALISLLMIAAFIATLLLRVPMDLSIIRDRNVLSRTNIDGDIENSYTINIVNKSQHITRYKLHISGLGGITHNANYTIELQPSEVYSQPITVTVPFTTIGKDVAEIYIKATTTDVDNYSLIRKNSFYGER